MGTSRRYAHVVDAMVDHRVAQTIMRSGDPLTLSPAELELDAQPLTRPPKAIPVKAWVRYPSAPLLVDGLATAWTARAVAVKWRGPEGDSDEHHAWLWISAVRDRRKSLPPGPGE